MVPVAFVALERLPLTAHGKVDRDALPKPTMEHAAWLPYRAPRTKLERVVARAFAEALGAEQVGLDDDFFALGGSSLVMARVGARLSAAYGVDLPLPILFTTPTVAGVSHMLELYWKRGSEGLFAARDPSILDAEAVLDEAVTPQGKPLAGFDDPGVVLLTGGTGFLGIFLLLELLTQTRAEVWCLTRASSPAAAIERLKATAAAFKVPWEARFDARVRPVAGDLTKPLLGLPPSAYEHLAETVDAIYHTGAIVNFVAPYSVLKGPNVDGTRQVLRLACERRVKAFHYVSTIDVLVGTYMPRPFLEVDLPPRPPRVPFSYAQSKWIAEKLVVAARDRGLPVVIYRPSIIMGHTKTGACHKTDYILQGMRGFLKLGILPVYDEVMNGITVDYASRAIVHLSRAPSSFGRIFHLWNVNAVPTMKMYDWIRSYGYEFKVVSFAEATEWARGVEPSHPIYPMLPVLFLYLSGDPGRPMPWEEQLTLDSTAECANTLAALEGTGIECPPIDERYMHDCLAFLIARGELDPPPPVRAPAPAPVP
jgi:myxalamid-type nonribosomal peptide synthetase MxaA